MKLKKKKQRSVKTLKRELDDIFSIYIRRRDKGVCYTCGVKRDWKDMDAGHYIKRQHNELRFDERNVHCQCRKCNRFEGGMMDEYAINLQMQYNVRILAEFNRKKHKIKQFKVGELEEMIKRYKRKTNGFI